MTETLQHKDAPKGHIHIIHNQEFATLQDRDMFIPTIDDLDKVCLIRTPYSHYALSSLNPTKWEKVGGEETKVKGIDYIEATNPTAKVNPTVQDAIWINRTSGEFFICQDNTKDLNVWKGSTGTAVAPKPAYKFDLLGDNSAVSFLQLDNDLIDMGGAYTITTANTIFESGKIDKCIKSISDNAKLDIQGAMKAISFWAWFPDTVTANGYLFDCRGYASSLGYCYLNANTSPNSINNATIYENKVQKFTASQFTKGQWVHVAINFSANVNGVRLLNNSTPSYGISNVKIDHVRCFNRALTSADLDKLYAEI